MPNVLLARELRDKFAYLEGLKIIESLPSRSENVD
jgi:hypothetical protein